MVTQSRIREGSGGSPARLLWLTLTALPCLCAAFVLADEPPQSKTAPAAKTAPVKKAAEKQADPKPANKKGEQEKKTKKKADAPPGYADALRAGDRPAPRAAAAVDVAEEVDAVEMDDGFEVLDLNVQANVANIEKQFLPQFKPLLTAELSFINRVCALNLEQRKQIHAVSEKCIKTAVRKYAMAQNGLMRNGFGRRLRTMPDPSELLHQALGKTLERILQPAQQAAYHDELAKRRAYRQQVAIENVVAIIDERLVLTIDQRKQLLDSLTKNWKAGWVQSAEMLMNSNQYLPSIPDAFVTSALNDTQKKVWRAAQKQGFSMWGGFAWGQQVAAVDDFPLVEVEVEVQPEPTSVN